MEAKATVLPNTGKVVIFVGLTCLLSWPTYLLGIGLLPLLAPMIAALFIQKFVSQEDSWRSLGFSFKPNSWFLIALVLPLLLAGGVFGISLLFPGVEYTPDGSGVLERASLTKPEQFATGSAPRRFSTQSNNVLDFLWTAMVVLVPKGVTSQAINRLGEAVGWRGFLQRELSYLGFWKSSAIIGVIWGIWHIPYLLTDPREYPEHPVEGVPLLVFSYVLLSPLFSYIRIKTKSVLMVAIFHGMMDIAAVLSLLLVRGSDLWVGLFGLAGTIVLILANVSIYYYERTWAREPAIGATYQKNFLA
jgi:membrane protease YdiL (CAAX protease family)